MDRVLARQMLKKYFGYDTFRPYQEEIIESVMLGNDTVAIMPTGGGKSICFQLPALMKEGFCLVVSPLIALMKDQVEGLNANGIPAAFINSTLSAQERSDVFRKLNNKELKLLYVSPEKLLTADFIDFIKHYPINLIAIDEAHCISMWGHDFRPEYTRLSMLKKQFPGIPLMALTATADRLTRDDMSTQLAMDNPRQFIASFNRPNISLAVLPGKKRFEVILDFVQNRKGQSGIIYCLSRKATEQLATKLSDNGVDAGFYHAGMSAEERSQVQDDFIHDRTEIICATIAFGMGIDKSNVRWVIHYNLPKNMEGYYQEIGRAGRDGLKSEALLFYTFRDVVTLGGFNDASAQRDLMNAKLQRMQEYAEAATCRRKILLSYFNEVLEENCGNCDVCKNPPTSFDGTIIAQKALSAIIRLKEVVPSSILIDVLRGSGRREVVDNGYHRIKTFGAGKEIRYEAWQQYLLQLLHQGLIEPAYDQNQALKVTEEGKKVLFEGKSVDFVEVTDYEKYKEERDKVRIIKPKKVVLEENLFDILRKVRKDIADAKGVAAYKIFSDATLREMASERPVSSLELLEISGVGDHKLEAYGSYFMNAITEFKLAEKDKGSTYLRTLALVHEGLTVEEISRERNLNPVTIYSHLAHLYSKGEPIDISLYIEPVVEKAVKEAIQAVGSVSSLKELYNHLDGDIAYGKIRLGIAIHQREQSGL